MPAPYSDLRWRIVWEHLLVKEQCSGMLSDTAAQGKFDHFLNVTAHLNQSASMKKLLTLQYLLLQPGMYLCELPKSIFDTTGTWVHISTICRAVHQLGLTHQHIQAHMLHKIR